MIIYYEPHKLFLKKLLSSRVEFILVGGYAVNFHGYNRQTGDLDIWLNPSKKNKKNFIDFLRKEGFGDESLNKIEALNFEDPNFFHFGEPPLRINFITQIKLVKFNDALNRAEILDEDDMKVPVLNFDDLIVSKITNDRLKDKLDVQELQKISQLKKRKKK